MKKLLDEFLDEHSLKLPGDFDAAVEWLRSLLNDPREVLLSVAFLDALIKRSPDAELVLQRCGRIRFQRAILAAVELYLEQQNIRPADIPKEAK